MNISDKILHYCRFRKIELKDFASKIDMTKSGFSNKMNGRTRFNEDDFLKMKEAFPDIDMNKLFNNTNDINIISDIESEVKNEFTPLERELMKTIQKIHSLSSNHLS